VRRDHGATPDAAQPRPVGEPVDRALARADAAASVEQLQRAARSLSQLARRVKLDVGRRVDVAVVAADPGVHIPADEYPTYWTS
jgi:hypothetical protein